VEQVPQNQEPSVAESDGDGVTARGGGWFNKRLIAFVDIPFAHTLNALPDGWRLEATAAGKLTVQLADGKQQKLDMVAGDQLSATGDEMYLYLKKT
jgi:hypothetical protein